MIRLLPTPNCMDMLPPHKDLDGLRRMGGGGYANLRDEIGLLKETIGMNERYEGSNTEFLPTPRARDVKGHNQRRNQDCLEGATSFGMRVSAGPQRTVDWGRFTPAIRRWETILDRPAPCPTETTGALRRWLTGKARPEWLDPSWLKTHAPRPDGRVCVDQPMRDRMIRVWRSMSDGSDLIAPFWHRIGSMDPDLPIPSTLLPAKCVTDYWDDMRRAQWRRGGSRGEYRALTLAHLSPRFSEWMMGLPDGWITGPDVWHGVDGNHRNMQLKLAGNGVVPQQAAAAIRWALDVRDRLTVGDGEQEVTHMVA